MPVLERLYYGNTVLEYGIAAAIVFGVLLLFTIAKRLCIRHIQKIAQQTEAGFDDVLVDGLVASKRLLIMLVAIHGAAQSLTLPPSMARALKIIALVAGLLQCGIWGSAIIRSWMLRTYEARREEGDTGSLTGMTLMSVLLRGAVWVVVVLLTLDNLGFDITTLVAGLGIGGVAVALALQNILGDLFSSISILLDRPFEVGDFIIVGELMGSVEKVGIKTTRVRSLSGEQLVFANSDLLSARIRNYKRMRERRIQFSVGVVYQTPTKKLEKIPELLQRAVEAQPGTRFDRAHLKSLDNSALLFEVVYFTLDPDYARYMDAQQAINLSILKQFEEQDIEVAYPTQTLHVHTAAVAA